MALTWLMRNLRQKKIENGKYIILRERRYQRDPNYEK